MRNITEKLIGIILSTLLIFTPLVYASEEPEETGTQSSTADTTGQEPEVSEFDQLKEKYADYLGLTQEERKEDFDYLWKVLKESYPYWGVVERGNQDMDWLYDNYLELALESDMQFYVAIYSMMYLMGGVGHLGLIEPEFYAAIKDVYADEPNRAYWHQVLNNPATVKNYVKYAEMKREIDRIEGTGNMQADAEANNQAQNVSAFILPGSETAYLGVNSFDADNYERDRDAIFAFYQTIGDCTDLIIDITANSGGSDHYWMDLLVGPHITEPLRTENLALIRQTEHTAPYLAQEYDEDDIHPIEQLPSLPALPDADRAMMSGYIVNEITVDPSETRSLFSGNIWVLVSERVYSSSEAFAVFCRQTGFATLVGSNTGGDGIGIDPAIIALPNSGYLLRYSMLYGLNEDGGCNEEYGTVPDIPSRPGEDPLVTVLRQLASQG